MKAGTFLSFSLVWGPFLTEAAFPWDYSSCPGPLVHGASMHQTPGEPLPPVLSVRGENLLLEADMSPWFPEAHSDPLRNHFIPVSAPSEVESFLQDS